MGDTREDTSLSKGVKLKNRAGFLVSGSLAARSNKDGDSRVVTGELLVRNCALNDDEGARWHVKGRDHGFSVEVHGDHVLATGSKRNGLKLVVGRVASADEKGLVGVRNGREHKLALKSLRKGNSDNVALITVLARSGRSGGGTVRALGRIVRSFDVVVHVVDVVDVVDVLVNGVVVLACGRHRCGEGLVSSPWPVYGRNERGWKLAFCMFW